MFSYFFISFSSSLNVERGRVTVWSEDLSLDSSLIHGRIPETSFKRLKLQNSTITDILSYKKVGGGGSLPKLLSKPVKILLVYICIHLRFYFGKRESTAPKKKKKEIKIFIILLTLKYKFLSI